MTPVEFRRHLHSNPELSFREEQTALFIEKQLSAEGIFCRRTASTGVIAVIDGEDPDHGCVVLRADIDALPIKEATGLPYASQNEGIMHACGHDFHAAMLFGALCKLNRECRFKGRIIGIFQPGEECNPGGAKAVLDEKPFEGINVFAILAAHVEAGMEVGKIGLCEGKFMASNDELRFFVNGNGGHAAERKKVRDNVTAAAELITRLTALNDDDIILSIGRVTAEGATNVIPREVAMEGTLRTFDAKRHDEICRTILALAKETDLKYGTTTTTRISHGYPCVVNDSELTTIAKQIAGDAAINLSRRATAEDFGRYGEHYPALLYRLGVGKNSGATHTPSFNPDESAIEFGIDFMTNLALGVLLRYGKKE